MKNIIWRCLKALPVLLLVFTLPAQASTGQMLDLTGNPAFVGDYCLIRCCLRWDNLG